LALCAGIGGIELGLKLVFGDTYRAVCYVEREAYNAACLVKRMEEGWLDKAPIWDDVGTFDGGPLVLGGKVDIVTAGFPCQPFSAAGKRLKERDERHLWPEIARIIGECKPRLVFLENVAISAFREPFDDLQAMGFSVAPPYAITAAELGAGHLRRRVFVLAHHEYRARNESGWSSRSMREGPTISRPAACDSAPIFRGQVESSQEGQVANTENRGSAWWASEPELERLVHGFPNRVERDRALGNAVVPIVAAKAFVELMRQI
jgi:DNA (cytosine-5)-methyltransferase 1